LKDAGQRPVAILSLARDITQRRSMEVEISGLYQAVQDQVGTVTHLYELASDISGVADGAALFGVLHRHIPRSLPAQVIEWYELAPDGASRLAHSAVAEVSGVTRHADGNAEIEEGVRSLLGSIAASKEPSVAEVGGRSVLGLPVKSAGMVAEAMVLRAAEGRSFTPAHLRLAGSIGSLTAIAMDRIRLYDGLLAKSRQIETRNRELDDFAYVVSHDLKEPLITIEGYAKILTSDYAGRLDQEGAQFLGSISGAVLRMKGMIEDLLTLARVGRTGEEADVVGLGDVIGEVLQDLEFSIREKKATVAIQGDMPSVTFDRAQLGIVFRNLLSNALKFNMSADPRVEISARVEPGEVIVSVADNGIGIEQEQHERIFRIFQRVFPRETFDGTGAGLAIVRNIVEHRGGRIWLDSKVGEGSTFFFSIPDA
jgi:signal transduction histidine kinase